VDSQLQKLMKQLGEAINESLSDSEQIADVIARIKSGGYDVFLVLEATIGFNKQDSSVESRLGTSPEPRVSGPDVRMSPQDVKFLRSLRISVGESEAGNRNRDNAA
jgi:hypothetical protein